MQAVEPTSSGFTGTISLHLVDLIQMVCLSRSDLAIKVSSQNGKGIICIRQGNIHHAATDSLLGEGAFFEILRWNDGQFQAVRLVSDENDTINKPWEHLLLEAMRQQDEGVGEQEETPSLALPSVTMQESQLAEVIGNIDDFFGTLASSDLGILSEASEQKTPEMPPVSTRVLIVDDSSFFSKKLKEMLELDPSIEVAGIARNGQELLDILDRGTAVDCITLDIEMPVMPGETTLKHVMIRHQIPVVIVSSLQPHSMTKVFDFLQLGAVDFLPKPSARDDYTAHAAHLQQMVKNAAKARLSHFKRLRKQNESARPPSQKIDSVGKKVILIVGGEGAHVEWFRLPYNALCRHGIVIGLQKLPEAFLPEFVGLIEKRTGVTTKPLSSDCAISPGTIYLGNALRPAEFRLNKEEPSLEVIMSKSETLEWKKGIDLWLNHLAREAGSSMAVYFLSAADSLSESSMMNLFNCNVRLILSSPQSLLCSQLVDSIRPYADQFPNQIMFSNIDTLPELL